MKKIVLIGTVGCGKTTLAQRLNGLKQEYVKTQAIEVINTTIDTPGEYMEYRAYLRNIMTTATDADLVLFLFDATQERFMYSPGQAYSFPVPVIGVVTKADIATPKQLADAKELLELAGATTIFTVSSVSGEGIEALTEYLK